MVIEEPSLVRASFVFSREYRSNVATVVRDQGYRSKSTTVASTVTSFFAVEHDGLERGQAVFLVSFNFPVENKSGQLLSWSLNDVYAYHFLL